MSRERLGKLYDRFGAPGLSVLALLALVLTLYAGGSVGLSDNGDFFRVMDAACLKGSEGGTFLYGSRFTMDLGEGGFWAHLGQLLFTGRGLSHYPSIHLVFVRLSAAGNLLLNALTGAPAETYRLWVLGGMYCLCWAGGLYLLFSSFRLPRRWADLAAKGLCLLVLCDVGYTAYFQSFYSEPAQMLGLLLMASFGLRAVLREEKRFLNGLLFFGSCLLYGWSKFINLPAAGLMILALAAVLLPKLSRRQALALGLAGAVSLGILVGVYRVIPDWMDDQTTFNAVFFGAMKDTDEETRRLVLEELGLPEEMEAYAGTNYYTERAAPFRDSETQQEALRDVSKADLLLLYLRHPRLLAEKLNLSMAQSGSIRPFYLDNLGGQPRPALTDRGALWSALRHRLPFDRWWWTLLLLAGAGVCVFLRLGRAGRRDSVFLCLGGLGLLGYQFLMPIVTNGEGDLMKHLFAFAQGMDLLFLLACAGALAACCRIRRWGALGVPALALLLAAAVVLPGWTAGLADAFIPAESGRVGSVWTLGGRTWQVVETEEDTLTLLAREPVTYAPFDGGGSSRWSVSSLRRYLDGAFLESFSPEERALLVPQTRSVPLARTELAYAQTGDDELYCAPVQTLCDRGLSRAKSETVTDFVTLPDLGLVGRLSRAGRSIRGDCWLESPYYGSSGMVRYLAGDGLVLFQTSDGLHGVRPVIRIQWEPA